MPKKIRKNNYMLGPMLMAFGLVIGIAALIGDNPIANAVNPVLGPILKPIADAIQGTQPEQKPSQSEPSNPTNPSTPSAPSGDSVAQSSGPQKTSSADLPPSVSSNLPQKVGSAVILSGSVQTVELQR